MRVQFLVSCMHEDMERFINRREWEKYDYVIVNQTNITKEVIIKRDKSHVVINSPERGLSRSRNRALIESIGVICDNDGVPVGNADKIIEKAYEEIPQADIIVFDEINKRFGDKIKKLKKFELLRVSSTEITFRRKKVDRLLCFDTRLGAGSDLGSGEENKFLMDAYKNKMNIYYYPQKIMDWPEDLHDDSTWFSGYDKKSLYNRGVIASCVLGKTVGIVYCLFYAVTKKKLYIENCNVFQAICYLLKGSVSGIKKRED